VIVYVCVCVCVRVCVRDTDPDKLGNVQPWFDLVTMKWVRADLEPSKAALPPIMNGTSCAIVPIILMDSFM
jgi:hypothetical protein